MSYSFSLYLLSSSSSSSSSSFYCCCILLLCGTSTPVRPLPSPPLSAVPERFVPWLPSPLRHPSIATPLSQSSSPFRRKGQPRSDPAYVIPSGPSLPACGVCVRARVCVCLRPPCGCVRRPHNTGTCVHTETHAIPSHSKPPELPSPPHGTPSARSNPTRQHTSFTRGLVGPLCICHVAHDRC